MSNVVSEIVNQQYNSARIKYDNIIGKLRCVESDEHCQLFEDDYSRSYCDTPIFACKFALKEGFSQYLALANEDGKLAVVDVSKKNKRFGTWAHHNAVFDIAWTYNSMKITTASGDHTARLFDITNCDIREERIFYGHSRSVKTVTYRIDDPNVFATGGRDGNIMIWDTRTEVSGRTGNADCQIRSAHAVPVQLARSIKKVYSKSSFPPAGTKSVTSLVFRDDNSLISCAAGDGLLKIWDLRKNYHTYKNKAIPKYVIAYPGEKAKNGFSNLIIDRDFTRLYANCLDNTIYCYNALTFNFSPIMKYQGHQNNTFYVKSSLSRDGNYLISGSSDENAYIWRTNSTWPFVKLTGHKAEVTCVAWCQEGAPLIATCSDDMKHKIWRVDNSESHSTNCHYICRGKAEAIDSSSPPRRPRLKRVNSVSHTISLPRKKSKVQCDQFLYMKNNKPCENCELTLVSNENEYTPLNKMKGLTHVDAPRCFLVDLDQNINDNRCLLHSCDQGIEHVREAQNINESNDDSKFKSPTNHISIAPTVNLPNFIVDGVAPHISQSPIKRKNVDWLTKMREEKTFTREIFKNYHQSNVSNLSKLDSLPRSSINKKQDIQCQQTSLLKFFKVKNSKSENLISSNKSVSCTIVNSLQSPSQ